MNDHIQPPDEEEDFPAASIRDRLLQLPSECATPSRQGDLAILRMASARMASIRRRSRTKKALIGICAMAACAALAILLNPNKPGPLPAETLVEAAPGNDEAAVILREVSTLFPNQIQSIQRDANGMKLLLADSPGVDSTNAVVLEIFTNGDVQQIITYSGQTIKLLGRDVTIRVNGDGGISLKGQGIEWVSTKPSTPLPEVKIRARQI